MLQLYLRCVDEDKEWPRDSKGHAAMESPAVGRVLQEDKTPWRHDQAAGCAELLYPQHLHVHGVMALRPRCREWVARGLALRAVHAIPDTSPLARHEVPDEYAQMRQCHLRRGRAKELPW